jgi:putative ABC transport system permease protein
MLRYLPYVLKNLFGHPVRTLLTVGGSALLMLLFGVVAAVQEGLARLTDPGRQDDRLIVFQSFRFCPSVSRLPHPLYEDEVRRVPGVREVLPIKVVVNNCRASLDTVVFHGVPPEGLRQVRRFAFLAGDWDAFARRRDGGALVGRKLAARRGLAVGKPFSIAGVTVNVEGIFASEQPGEENIIYTHLTTLLNQTPGHHQDLEVTMYEVHVDDPARAEAVARAIDDRIRGRYPVTTETRPQKAYFRQALADLVELVGFTRWLGIVCVGVVGVLVANSVIMAAQDRVREHAVLQTIGFAGGRIFALMLAESLLLCVVGGGLGVAAAWGWLSWQPLTVSTEGVSVDFLPSAAVVGWGLGLSALVGLLAGLVPAWQAGRREIVEGLR